MAFGTFRASNMPITSSPSVCTFCSTYVYGDRPAPVLSNKMQRALSNCVVIILRGPETVHEDERLPCRSLWQPVRIVNSLRSEMEQRHAEKAWTRDEEA